MKYSKKDEKYIKRCIDLGKHALANGEAPFGSLITINGRIISEGENRVKKSGDISQHAEMIVLFDLQRKLKEVDIKKCTLYTICEPCPMCSFMIRELKLKKVVYSLPSPYMGGQNKWNILQDNELEQFSPPFFRPPVVVGGVLMNESLKVFRKAGWGHMFIRK